MNRHWTEDDFVAKVYGIGRDDGHLDACAACRESWMRFETRRGLVLASVQTEVPRAVLVTERRAILERLAAGDRPVLGKLIPVLAAAGTVALGMFLAMPSWRPTANPPQAVTGQVAPWLSDAQLFQETAAIGQSSEPRGARPIEALFQE
jgi:hypothetical protein